ncbi:uroporphyrinogen-III synthase [Actinopolyspora mortivallis]|uniref:Uroporphyrinogen-III synthase n=1 Tax=Actinopolyspora mortivallis TaxID=33906 RepID=A0A2T0GYA2_ACTMO|nr:uroporphyrinogen-III synthase [Actinopolyspora mortivallis]PRW64013.1 uroporphyrinogen-III synthase [Actinopolyspora mortivallis]
MTTTPRRERVLSGFVVGTTTARRAEELEAMLLRRGAEIRHAPATSILPLTEAGELFERTRSLLEDPPDTVVVTTGIGFRGWLEAAEWWGTTTELSARLASARILTRGPKATGAVRAAGLVESWSPGTESTSEILAHLLEESPRGRRVAVQRHGRPMPEFTTRLRAAGVEVIELPVYRCCGPRDPVPLSRLVESAVTRQLDSVVFTSAPAVVNTLELAESTGRRKALIEALCHHVLTACVGPVCAAPLEELGVPVVLPERPRLGALVRSLDEILPRRTRSLRVNGRHLELRGGRVWLGGEPRHVPPGSTALLHKLAEVPGRVFSREELAEVLPNGGRAHAVEMAVGRLRTALDDERIVQTVVKRGYRLALDETEMRHRHESRRS